MGMSVKSCGVGEREASFDTLAGVTYVQTDG
jgi:hypothetical protein